MDERHWWFAAKLQETFHFGGYDNPTLLEDFLSESDVGDLINKFLSPGEPCKVFFYCSAAPPRDLSSPDALGALDSGSSSPSLSRTLHVTSRLTKDVVAQGCVCLYVLRKNVESEIEFSMMEKELFCGEIRQSLLSSLAMLLTEAYLPILQSQVDWGQCSEESIASFLQSLSKFSSILSGVASEVQMKRPVLKQPSRTLLEELTQGHGGGGAGSIASGGGLGGRGPDVVLKEVDTIITDWSSTIESLIIEIMDERLEDPHGTLISEQRKWQRKYTMVVALSDQLKSKECRKIITALFTLKSRLTKKWKAIDIQVTEAFNSTRDHLHYLEVFSPHLEALESRSPPAPGQIITTVLPAFSISMRQKEGMSKVFARSGFLGGLLTKLSNTLIRICVSKLESFCYVDGADQFWPIVSEAIVHKVECEGIGNLKKSKGSTLLLMLESFLEMSDAFKNFVSQTRNAYFTSNTSNLVAPSLATTKRLSLTVSKSKVAIPSSLSSSDPSELLTQASDGIMQGVSEFTSLVSKVLEVIDTLTHYMKLVEEKRLRGLPRFAGLWALQLPYGSEEGDGNTSLNQSFNQSDVQTPFLVAGSIKSGAESSSGSSLATEACLDMLAGGNSYCPEQSEDVESLKMPLELQPHETLGVLKEESWVCSVGSGDNQSIGTTPQTEDTKPSTTTYNSTTASFVSQQTNKMVHWMASESQMNSVGVMVQYSLRKIKDQLEYDCIRGVADVFAVGRNRNKAAIFVQAFQNYSDAVSQLDSNISAYLKALFCEGLSTDKALDTISCFSIVSSRPAVKRALDKCMVTAFTRYGLELEELQNIYERDKSCPSTSRDAPPVTTAVQWSRHLLSKVQKPMDVFRKSAVVMQSMESVEISRLHNRLATVLLRYESLWLNRWKSSIEVGQSVLKAPLLHQEGNAEIVVIKVNCIQKLLELFAECKGLIRQGIPVPEAVYVTLTQEARVKEFKQQLDHLLREYHSTKDSIDPYILPLMSPHIDSAVRCLLPGWTTLTWNTMNIDAFLHRAQTSIDVLRELTTKVNSILQKDVYGCMNAIKKMSLFDVTLATSRMWNLQEFTEIMLSSIIERSNKLLGYISIIHIALVDILFLTYSHRKRQLPNQLPPLLSPGRQQTLVSSGSKFTDKQSIQYASIATSNKSTSQGSSRDMSRHSMKHSQSTGTVVLAGTPTPQESMRDLEPAIETAMLYFCETTLDIAQKMILQSHEEYSNSLQSMINNNASSDSSLKVENLGANSGRVKRVVRFDVPDSPEKIESLVEVLKQDNEALQDKLNSLMSTFSERSLQVEQQLLKLVVDIRFSIPDVILCPNLSEVESHLTDVSSSLLGVLKKIKWWLGPGAGKSIYELLEVNGVIQNRQTIISQAIRELSPSVKSCLQSLHFYDFIWIEDLHAAYKAFLNEGTDQDHCLSHVRGFMDMEKQIEAIPPVFTVGPLQLSAKPAKNSLKALAVSWKIEFYAFVHEKAKSLLDEIVGEHERMISKLQEPVDESLEKLRDILLLLQNISDLQHVVDEKFLPVEQLYAMLREFDQYLPRIEVRKVDGLRSQWEALTKMAENVKHVLLYEKRQDYESEVDKQVKSFGVETIRFRNSFDSEGPLVPGLHPNIAVERLGAFLDHCEALKTKRNLLDSVQNLLNIPLKPYPELDQTEQDLSYLRALYDNYQQFISFDTRFRQELWSEVDLHSAQEEVQRFWEAYSILPIEQQEWEASRNLEKEIRQYLEILPLLMQLHSKEIRNRHWLQVMTVVNCTFQLEGTVFRMAHLIDSNLLLYVPAIQEIIKCAKSELHLEEKLYSIEEEWSEQALVFQQYRGYGSVLLALDHTHSLMERLEHAQVELATMLMSQHIQPLKEEAIQWAAKLSSLADILQQWLLVQKLWNNLEAVFNTPGTASEFQEEAVKFASIHKRWLKLMKKASDTKNILTCCGPGEGTHSSLLAGIRRELEHCKKSLSTYLQTKREAFPRFFYVSDDTLLSILSNSKSVSSVKPHLASVFGSIANLLTSSGGGRDRSEIIAVESVDGERLDLANMVPLSHGVEQWSKDLLSSIQSTLRGIMTSPACHGEQSLEEVAHSQVSQVAIMALYFQWCKECENALLQCRYDRRALPGARNKFLSGAVNKLVALLARNTWKATDEVLTSQKRASVESLVAFSMWLRDMLEDLCRRKLKDIEDFEWQRFLKPQLKSLTDETPKSETPIKKGKQLVRKSTTLDFFSVDEPRTIFLCCLQQQIEYGFEYLCYTQSLPLFETRANNYIISFTQSSRIGSLLMGPIGVGKKNLVETIGQVCGRNVLTLYCLPLMYGSCILRTMEGLIRGGGWGCFSNVDNLPPASLSVLSQMMQIVANALDSKISACTLPSSNQVMISPGVSIFLTSRYAPNTSPWTPPPSLAPIVRTFSFLIPNPSTIVRSYSTALGIKGPKAIANKLITLQNMAKEQLSRKCPQAAFSVSTICHVLKVASQTWLCTRGSLVSGSTNSKPSPEHTSVVAPDGPPSGPTMRMKSIHGLSSMVGTSTSVLKEHGLIAQVALNIIGASLPAQELSIFNGMIKEVFCGSLEAESIYIQHSICPQTSIPGFLEKLKVEAEKAGLEPSQSWICKMEQLSAMAQLKHAVILVGQPATGKSSALNTLISILNAEGRNDVTIKLSKVYPNAVDDLSELFGCVNPNTGDWEDGVFTSIFRKAHQATQSVTWLCIDGFLDPAWVQYVAELLDKDKTLTLSNGECLVMNESALKLISEVESLEQASPAALLNAGIVHFGGDVLGWRPVVKSWLKKRNIREAQTLLKYFQQIMDEVVEYIVHKVGKQKLYSEVALLESCLALLSTLLKTYNETAEVFSEVHIERLLLFSVIWSYGGGLVGSKEQMNFSYLLKTLTNSLPDDDSQLSVFDYYVDESGEWDVWQSRLPLDPELHVDMLGSVYVNTVDTNRVEILLELALASRRHTLIVGPHGSGKTTIYRHFLQGRGGNEVFKQIILNGYSKSDTMFDFMKVNFHHRQGYTYGPKQGKLLECFIDDLHLPLKHSTNSSSCSSHEYLRQLADLKGIYNLQKTNEYSVIEDFILFACMTGNSEALISPRLRRHMIVIYLPDPCEANRRSIVSQQLSGLLKAHCHEMSPKEFETLLEASLELYANVKEILRVSDTPGRLHYFFSIKHLVSVFQGICQCISEGYSDKLNLCWIFEAKRAFTDGLCRANDIDWMHKTIERIAFSKIKGLDDKSTEKMVDTCMEPFILSAFSPEIKQGNAILPSTSFSLNILPQVNLFCLEDWSELKLGVSQHIRRYKEENGENYDLDLSNNNLHYLVQLHRAFMFSKGNTIMVGALGQELTCLTLLALFLAGYELQSLDISNEPAFKEGMKTLLRQAGLGGKPVGIIMEESDLKNVKILQELNSIVSSGELPNLFTNDELEGLLQALVPSVRRDFPTEDTDPMQYFIAKVFRNIRFIFCLTPNSPLLGSQAHDYKGLLEGCNIIWTCDWTSEALLNSANYFFASNPYVEEIEESLRSPVTKCLLAIHSFAMQQTGQLIQAGLHPDKVGRESQQVSYQFTGSPDHSKVSKPTTYEILVEKLLRLNSALLETRGLEMPYVGPKTLIQFLECFCEIFHTKFTESEAEKAKLTKALGALHNTHEQVVQMKSTLKELRQHHDEVSKSAEKLLNDLISKSCQLEKLKAVMGESSSVYSAMQMVNELERKLMEADDEDELLALCLDKRASRLEGLLQKAQDRVKAAENEAAEAKQIMTKAKEVAQHWQSKIDRSTIDEVKRINSPPHLVGTIMELMLTLLNQYGSGSGARDQSQSSSTADESSSTATPGHTAGFMSKKKKTGSSAASTAKMEKEQWNSILLAMGDSQKFLDMLNNLKWEDGLSTDASNLILSKLAVPGRNVPISESDISIDKADEKTKTKDSFITVSMARYAAEAAGFMCAFAISIVEYSDTFKPYKIALEKLARAQLELQEIEKSLQSESSSSGKLQEASLLLHKSIAPPVLEDVMEEAEGGQETLEVLQAELDELQGNYDEVVKEKYSLAHICQQLSERLKSANYLLDSLKERRASWQHQLDLIPTVRTLAARCIIAASVTVYCGPLKTNDRHNFFQKLLAVCKLQGFNTSEECNLDLAGYPLFMLGKASLYHLVKEGLPQDSSSLQNAAILAYPYAKTWPLILDSLGMADEWMKRKEGDILATKYQNGNINEILVKAMDRGLTLLISNICAEELCSNSYLQDVLHCRKLLLRSKHPVKIMINDVEVDCSPKFKLVLFTSDKLSAITPELASLVSIVSFHPEVYGIQQSILDSFLQLHNEKISQNRDLLRMEMYCQTVQLVKAERALLELLMKQEGGNVEDPHVTKNILSLNKAYEDALENRTKAEVSYNTMNTVHLSHLQSLASQAGVIMSTVWVMGAILPTYRVSYSTMLSVFLNYIEQMGSRIVGEDMAMKMTRAVYYHFVKGYFEKDRHLFSFLLSGEIEMNQGRATREEQEFLISPSLGQKFTIRGVAAYAGSTAETSSGPVLQFGRKPFDWMSDSQWQMFLLLASHFSWMHPILDKLGKDGKDAVWRTIGEGVAPETINLNETLGHKLLPMQQLLILSAMRPERMSQCMESFVYTVLEPTLKQRRISSVADVTHVVKNLKPTEVPVILFREDPDLAVTRLQQYTSRMEIPFHVCYLHGTGQDEIDSAKNAMEKASQEGHWILLHNIQSCPSLLSSLPLLLDGFPQRQKWKVWISLQGDTTSVPTSLLYSANKLILDPPLSLYSCVLYCLNNLPADVLTTSSRVEWLPGLHCMAMLHAILCLRRHIYSYSLMQEFNWSFSNFIAAVKYMMNDFISLEESANSSKPVSWSGIRYMIAEVIYGSAIVDATSLNVLSALVDHWMHTGGPKREVGRYHIPSPFFVPFTRLSALVQAVEAASPPLVLTAEICGLHFSPIIRLGWVDYQFSTMAYLYGYLEENMAPSTDVISSGAQMQAEKRDSLKKGSAASILSISKVHQGHAKTLQRMQQTYVVIEKLPSFISVPSNLTEVHLSHLPGYLLETLTCNPSLLKRLPLQYNIERLMEKFPSIWKKELVNERLKKHGSETPFGMFMKSEVAHMIKCCQFIQDNLKEILVAISLSTSGDTLMENSHLVSVALSLLSSTVPQPWQDAVGPSAPPSTWPLKDWLQDLFLRYTFLDRVMYGGLAKMATYWLGGFFNPAGFLNIIQQAIIRSTCDKTGTAEQLVFHAELTNRDKDHIRDPPPEGELFVYGAYVWACAYERSGNGDFQEIPPKQVPVPLPVLHLTASILRSNVYEPPAQTITFTTEHKGPYLYHCPCFISNNVRHSMPNECAKVDSAGSQCRKAPSGECSKDILFTVTMTNSEMAPSKWSTRNVACTLRPF